MEQLNSRAVDKQRMLDVNVASDLLPRWFRDGWDTVPEFTGSYNGAVGFLADRAPF